MSQALFAEPDKPEVQLSQYFQKYALTSGVTVKWTARNLKNRVPCQECLWVVHESHGQSRQLIRRIKQRRTLSTGDYIDMCTAHAVLWKAADDEALSRM